MEMMLTFLMFILFYIILIQHGDDVVNTTEENSGVFSVIHACFVTSARACVQ